MNMYLPNDQHKFTHEEMIHSKAKRPIDFNVKTEGQRGRYGNCTRYITWKSDYKEFEFVAQRATHLHFLWGNIEGMCVSSVVTHTDAI